MKQLLLAAYLLLASALASFGQTNYLEQGNEYLNNGQVYKAELTFREAVKSDSGNLIYQCQLGLALIQQKIYPEAEKVLNNVLKKDSNNIAAIWYLGIGSFSNRQDRQAIARFEKALPLLDKSSQQYYSAYWFIATCYSNLLKTEGLTYTETDRMFACYEAYLRLQPNAEDAGKIKEFMEIKKRRRPPPNVKKWIDK